MPQRPTSRELINKAMRGRLDAYLAKQRAAEPRVSYPRIVWDLHERTGVLVDPRTVERWCKGLGL